MQKNNTLKYKTEMSLREIQLAELEIMKIVHSYFEQNKIEYYMLGGSILGAVRHHGFIPWDDDIDIGLTRPNYDILKSLFWDFNEKYKGKYEIKDFTTDKYCNYVLIRVFKEGTCKAKVEQCKKMDKRLYLDIFPLDKTPNDNKEFKDFSKRLTKEKNTRYFIFPHKTTGGSFKLFLKRIYSLPYYIFRKRIMIRGEKLLHKYDGINSDYLCSCASQYSPERQRMKKEIYGKPTLYKFEDTYFYGPEDANAYLNQLFGKNYMEIPPINERRGYIKVFKE